MNSDSKSVRAFLLAVILQCYRPRPTGSVWQFAEKEVYLTKKESPGHPGPYDSSLTPYTRESQDFLIDPDWDEDITQKSSQAGFTEAVLNCIRYCVAFLAMNVLYSIDSRDEAKKIMRTRLEPSIDKFVPENLRETVEDDDKQTLALFLPHMTIYMAGGHSGGALANKAIGMGVVDEANEHPAPAKGEMENTDLVRDRLKTVPRKKLFILSKPTDEFGLITREYETGTQSKYHVPCPDCGHYQELVLEQLRFEHCKDMLGEWDMPRVLTETFYACARCYDGTNPKPREEGQPGNCGEIRDRHKYEFNLAGKWVITNPKHFPRRRSRHISDFYSPFVTFGEIAVDFLGAVKSGSLVKMQGFYNSRLGLPFRQQGAQVTESDVSKCRGPYKRGTCLFTQEETCLITQTTDKQGDVFKSTKAAWKKNGDMCVVDYAIHLAEQELLDWAQEPITVFAGETREPMTAKIGLIDEGYLAKISVREFVQRSGGFYFGSKGRGGIQVKNVVTESKTVHDGAEMVVYHYDDDDFKKQLYIARIAKLHEIISGKSKTPRMWLPENIEYDFAKELWAERLEEEKQKWGPPKWLWKMVGEANDFGDALKMQLVVWYIIGHYFNEEQEEEERVEETAPPAETVK
jgi:phage terminase large subunit GpA-like protein